MNKELVEGLKRGLKNEIAGEEFYTKTANEAKDDFTKNTFKHLAKDEKYHIKRIKEFIQSKKIQEVEKKIKEKNPKNTLEFFGMNIEKFKKKKVEKKLRLNFRNKATSLWVILVVGTIR